MNKLIFKICRMDYADCKAVYIFGFDYKLKKIFKKN